LVFDFPFSLSLLVEHIFGGKKIQEGSEDAERAFVAGNGTLECNAVVVNGNLEKG